MTRIFFPLAIWLVIVLLLLVGYAVGLNSQQQLERDAPYVNEFLIVTKGANWYPQGASTPWYSNVLVMYHYKTGACWVAAESKSWAVAPKEVCR